MVQDDVSDTDSRKLRKQISKMEVRPGVRGCAMWDGVDQSERGTMDQHGRCMMQERCRIPQIDTRGPVGRVA